MSSQFEIIQSKTNYSSLKDSYWIQVSLGLVKRLTASLYNFASFSTVRKFFMTNPFITNNSMNSLRSINNAWSIMSSKESSFLKSSYIDKIKTVNDLLYDLFSFFLQDDPKVSERFFNNGCGIQMSQASPTFFFSF